MKVKKLNENVLTIRGLYGRRAHSILMDRGNIFLKMQSQELRLKHMIKMPRLYNMKHICNNFILEIYKALVYKLSFELAYWESIGLQT